MDKLGKMEGANVMWRRAVIIISCFGFTAVGAQERPSWRSGNEVKRPEEIPTIERSEVATFSVDREALMGARPELPSRSIEPEAEPELAEDAPVTEPAAADPEIVEPQVESVAEAQQADTSAQSVTTEDVVPAEVVVQEPVEEIPVAEPEVVVAEDSESLAVASVDTQPVSSPGSFAQEDLGKASPEFSLNRIRAVAPDYPRAAYRDRQEGWVDLEVTVNPKGDIQGIEVVESEPRRIFDRAAVRAASRWVFEPPANSGQTTPVSRTYRIVFKM